MNLVAAFCLGLAGSLHCAVMCGPLVIAINAARRQNHFHGAAYHGGRIAVYGLLGAFSGLIGAALVFAGFQRWISITAGCLILLASLASFRARWGGLPGKYILMARTRFGRLLSNRTFGAAFLLGGLNGLLPCGLVYVACAAAGATGGIGAGIVTMLAFGLGTAPMMLSVSVAGRAVHWSRPLRLRRVVSICATAAGVLLIARGLSLGIPYVSPRYHDGKGPTCPCLKQTRNVIRKPRTVQPSFPLRVIFRQKGFYDNFGSNRSLGGWSWSGWYVYRPVARFQGKPGDDGDGRRMGAAAGGADRWQSSGFGR